MVQVTVKYIDGCLYGSHSRFFKPTNIFHSSFLYNCRGFAAVLQTLTSLRILNRGIPLCEALEYQQLIGTYLV